MFWRNPDGAKRSEVHPLKRDADAKKADVESTQHRGTYVDPQRGREPFRDYATRSAKAQDWKASTRKGWAQHHKRLDPILGDLRMASLDREALEGCRNKLAKTYSRGVVEGTMQKAIAIARYAHANGDIGRDPTIGVAAAPKRRADDPTGKVTPDQVPTTAEALSILTGAPNGYRAAVALGLAGCRIGEVLGMHVERIDLAARKVAVYWQTDGYDLTTPKAEKRRAIIVPQLVAVELRRHLRDHPSGLLFPGGGRQCPCGCGQRLLHRERFYELAWYPALASAGLGTVDDNRKPVDGPGRFVFHALRHFCASTLLAKGAPITAAAGYLGDTVETVSRVYAHWLRDDREVPASVLDQVLAPPAERDASPTPHAESL